jgi:hypothetical protein
MTEPYHVLEPDLELHEPVLVVALSGWIDASGSAAAAIEAVETAISVRTVVTFDDDAFIDYRARRPVMELREGLNTRLVWNLPKLKAGRDRSGKDVLVLSGPEPDMGWRRFARCVAALAQQHRVPLMVGLGAYPFTAPHTRPPRISCTSPSADMLAAVAYLRSSVDVPAGVEALLEHALHDVGIKAIGLWAQVPHYVSAMAYPAASSALVAALAEVAGLDLDPAPLAHEAMIQRQRLDALIAGNDEYAAMLRQLEAAYDSSEDERPLDGPLPSGEELAREVEQFLREHGGER